MEAKGFWIHEFIDEELTSSRFIETPAKKLLRIQEDFTGEGGTKKLTDYTELHPHVVLFSVSVEEITRAFARCDFTVWQDEAALIDKEKLKAFYLSAGALDVDIRIVRIPRQNVRSEAVLKSETLRDKIQKMAELKEEQVAESVLIKAEYLENMSADELIEYGGLTS